MQIHCTQVVNPFFLPQKAGKQLRLILTIPGILNLLVHKDESLNPCIDLGVQRGSDPLQVILCGVIDLCSLRNVPIHFNCAKVAS